MTYPILLTMISPGDAIIYRNESGFGNGGYPLVRKTINIYRRFSPHFLHFRSLKRGVKPHLGQVLPAGLGKPFGLASSL